MRILHVTDHFPPTLGGIEAHVSELAARQSAHGHQVSVLTCRARVHEKEPARAYDVVRARSRFEVSLDPRSFDVVHAHLSVVAPFTAPVAARFARRGTPTVATVHSLWNGWGPGPGWAAGLSGLAGSPVTWTAVSSVAAASVAGQLGQLGRLGGAGSPQVGVLSNAVDVAPRGCTPMFVRAGPTGPARLVTTMRIARRKRPLALVAMVEALVRPGRRPVQLTVIGDGPLMPRMARAVAASGLDDRVCFTGRVSPPEVLGLVAAADVYVAPARLESFGLAALEARSLGLPVVGYSFSGLSEFVEHGREGLLANTDAGVTEHLARLVDDPDLLAAMSERNRTVRPDFTWCRALRAHDAVYDEARRRAGRTHRVVLP